MKKILMYAVTAVLVSCQYDDGALRTDIDNLDKRVSTLEEQCRQMNTNIISLQALVEVLQRNDYVTGTTPIISNGEEIGHTITFANSAPVTIYHGTDGKNGEDGEDGEDGINGIDGNHGYTPVIGARIDTDGVYYWTIDGEWLLDSSSKKIPTSGKDGQNGVDGKNGEDGEPGLDGQDGKDGANGTNGSDGRDGVDGKDGKDAVSPQIRIVDGRWQLSIDDGETWSDIGQATGDKGTQGEKGEKGDTGGDTVFSGVQETDEAVIFTLTDDTQIIIPKLPALSVSFDLTGSMNVLPGKTYEIGYTITGGDENTVMDVVAQNGYRATVNAVDALSGTISVGTPDPVSDDRVLVFVSDGRERTIMCTILFAESVIRVVSDEYTVEAEGETVTVEVHTNVGYTVEIPEADRNWISHQATRAAVHTETFRLVVAPNTATTYRYSTIELEDASGMVGQSILISQKAAGYKTVHVATAGTLESYLSANEKQTLTTLKITGSLNTFDFDFMKTMPDLRIVDLAQLSNTTIPASAFSGSKVTTVLLPLNLTAIPSRAFYQSRITAISFPATVESIGSEAFRECANLAGELILPGGLKTISSYAFYNCAKLTGNLTIPNSVTSLGEYAFYGCSGINGTLMLSEGLTTIAQYAFYDCSGFTGNLIIPENVTEVGSSAFRGCAGFNGYLSLGSKMTSIGNYAFVHSSNSGSIWNSPEYYILNFSKIYFKASVPPPLGSYAFGHSEYRRIPYLGVPVGSLSAYNAVSTWSRALVKEEIEF